MAPFVSPWYNLYVSGGEAGRKTRHRSAMDPRAEVAGPEGVRLLNGDGILCGMLLPQADPSSQFAWGAYARHAGVRPVLVRNWPPPPPLP